MEKKRNVKLIAKFMGLKLPNGAGYLHPYVGQNMDVEEAEYHTSWEWIMPVIKKIRQIDFDDADRLKHNITLYLLECDIKYTHKAVVAFIKCYNDNKKGE